MKIIISRDIPNLGKPGDIKNVAGGYARNFLFPNGFAEPATDTNVKTHAKRLELQTQQDAREREQYERLASSLESKPLMFPIKIAAKGKAFGSISTQDIADALAKAHITIEKQWIVLSDNIKTTGEHFVKIQFPHGVEGKLRVVVEAEKTNEAR